MRGRAEERGGRKNGGGEGRGMGRKSRWEGEDGGMGRGEERRRGRKSVGEGRGMKSEGGGGIGRGGARKGEGGRGKERGRRTLSAPLEWCWTRLFLCPPFPAGIIQS